ncbi:MAG: DUF1330 domain-containing protein [Bacteroidota bacterium]
MTAKVVVIIVALINPAEKEALASYMGEMKKMYAEVDASVVFSSPLKEKLAGEMKANLISIMEFPDQKAFDKVFKSEAYQKLLPLREKAFLRLEVFLGE